MLIPQMHDPYTLSLVVKVTNQALRRYKIQHQLVFIKEDDILIYDIYDDILIYDI